MWILDRLFSLAPRSATLVAPVRRWSNLARCRLFRALLAFCLGGVAQVINAAPGDILFEDDFKSNLNKWTVVNGSGDADLANGSLISNSDNKALQFRWGTATVTSDAFNASVTQAEVSVWVKRGFDSNSGSNGRSEEPDSGENLIFEYLNSAGIWLVLETFPGAGTPAEVFNRVYSLPNDALHAALQLRLRLTGGSGSSGNGNIGYDYWHVDDVVVTDRGPPLASAEWRFDEDSWSNAAGEVFEETGSYPGTPFNDVSTDDGFPAISGTPGTCGYGDFDGSNDYVALPGLPNLQGSFTITAWIQARDIGSDQRIFADDEQNTGGYSLSLGDGGDGRLRFFSRTVNPIIVDTQNAVISPNTWHFIAAVHDASGKTRQIYVDGVAVQLSSGSTISSYTGNWGADNGTASIGGETNAAGSEAVANWRFNGLIDEVRIFPSALSAGEVTQVMDDTHPCKTPPVADWRFDETSWNGSAGEIEDSSGNNYHGSAVNANVIDPGFICNAANLSLDSNSDYLSMHNGALNGREDFTISVWAQSLSHSGISTIMSGAAGSTSVLANELYMLFDGATTFRPGISASTFALTPGITVPAINDSAWHHYVWTRHAASRTSCLFRDGVSMGCITNPDADDDDPLTIVSGGLVLGQDQDIVGGGFESSQDWQGYLDEVLVFDRVLSQSEIQEINANQLAGNNWDGSARVCPSVLDHFAILHDGTGITCAPEDVAIEAHLANHAVDTSFADTVTLSTSTNNGDWSLAAGNGLLTNNGNGSATYTFVASDNGRVDLRLANTLVETLNIDVVYGSITDQSGTEDEDLRFLDSGFEFILSGGGSTIGTQISGKDSQVVVLRAIEASESVPACVAALTGNVTIDMAFETVNPATDKGLQVEIAGIGGAAEIKDIAANNAGSVSNYTPITLSFDSNGDAPFQLNYPDAGSIRLHARHPDVTPGGGFIEGGSNAFVTKPAGICVQALEAGSDCSSGDASCSVFKAAGEEFVLNVRAVTWQSDTESNADFCSGNATTPNFQLADVKLSQTLVAPTGGNAGGSLPVNAIDFTASDDGSKNSNEYVTEVGVFRITATPLSGGYLSETIAPSTSANIGRFIPAEFRLSAPSLIEACVAGDFTYMDQPFDIGYTLTAYNALNPGNPSGITQNYQGDFAKLTSSLGGFEFGAIDTGTALTARLSNDTSGNTFNWSAGVGTLVNNLTLARDSSPDGPYAAQVGVLPSDADGVTVPSLYRTLDDMVSVVDFVPVGESGQRYGRIFVNNAYGPEELDLGVTLQAEFFDTAQAKFALNTLDSCTSFSLSGTLDNYNGNLNLGETGIAAPSTATSLFNGRSPVLTPLTLSAPGIGNDGSVDVTLTVSDWLKFFDYDADTSLDNPKGKATFGQFRGNDRIIYWREQIPVR